VGVVGMAAAGDHAPDGAVDGRSWASPAMFGRAECDLDSFVVLVPLGRLMLDPGLSVVRQRDVVVSRCGAEF
jgi:hypothetical protein